ncbi:MULTISPECIES: bifunctional glutamate--cysteine ligase GshA/glutathione synthetase GshB [unclassified Gemella]|uniref:bifunctional glutamate--cysteine ligase GshA/glutathione synthetase GshB n=1 Tax=unclassified Gemella TaxID=2624949 RepID=UPI00107308E6|nr:MULTISPECIES: bifunctional glutamate--cysteine ligase GshA/glutathione synthetase GshB [unclassified Gemella]MBF0710308.1 bifunctional glutamate--cysteine ligase GshA/glutathione synthetase GshB [Gemella sp. GL1.1]MBF0746984.1 bifunctional glutamate--cysteine ligase GshA/glutathione synthetase GshB [Gemella sp. 19428wG2_WT2a]NYS27652.1 bifunctional glutamate--cysteine ligase GshA/glutathione synthetase GshB [Gemella sp. GL1]TFU58802.1 bifunctional glutamate--cysteine ligase GshA/glutathione 
MNFRKIIIKKNLFSLYNEATIGIEKEGHRVLADGQISKSDHPRNIGNRLGHPYIQTDFAESQLELITSAEKSERQVYRYLSAIHEVVLRKIPRDEYIWPMSVPGIMPKLEDIRVAQFDNPKDVEYRNYLVKTYGKCKQILSGIHYNFGFSQDFINSLLEESKLKENEVRNQLYIKLARQFIRYQWLLIYLYGASPIAPDEFFEKLAKTENEVRCLRYSKYGYVNDNSIKVSFNSIEEYAKDIRSCVDSKQLIAEKEFYSSVRFRGSESVSELVDEGVQYLEFRLFDLNPYAKYGIEEKDIRFIHLFILLMLWLDEENPSKSVEIGKDYSQLTSLDGPLSAIRYKEEANFLFQELLNFLDLSGYPTSDIELVKEKMQAIDNVEKTLAARLWNDYKEKGSMAKLGMELAIKYKKDALDKYYSLTEFSSMELSTQALMADAISQGIKIEILDEHDQFLKLSYKDHIEYVKNGNMTKHDSYISPLIMENKLVTKKVLEDAKLRVPKSYQYTNIEDALRDFSKIQNKAIVVKPKSTNYGLGISIFSQGIKDIKDYEKAVSIALAEDREIMIEEYITGTEYRFFVLKDKTLAVLERVPANVMGDGKSTIKELVKNKNKSPLRGDGLSSPLKKIKLGDIEELQLKEQGFNFNSILEEGQIAYLRANSNISTGGDSIDRTDEVHPSYKDLAVKITQAMGAKVCGVDLMIEDLTQAADKSNYGVIEANFNPMMMMHIFPAQGKSRRLTENVLEMLFPEKYNK